MSEQFTVVVVGLGGAGLALVRHLAAPGCTSWASTTTPAPWSAPAARTGPGTP